jgi:hypothetical protein
MNTAGETGGLVRFFVRANRNAAPEVGSFVRVLGKRADRKGGYRKEADSCELQMAGNPIHKILLTATKQYFEAELLHILQ